MEIGSPCSQTHTQLWLMCGEEGCKYRETERQRERERERERVKFVEQERGDSLIEEQC